MYSASFSDTQACIITDITTPVQDYTWAQKIMLNLFITDKDPRLQLVTLLRLNINSPDRSPYISLKNVLREFDKSKFPLHDHIINLQNLFF